MDSLDEPRLLNVGYKDGTTATNLRVACQLLVKTEFNISFLMLCKLEHLHLCATVPCNSEVIACFVIAV